MKKDLSRAIADCLKAAAIDPSDAIALERASDAFRMSEDFENAVEYARKSLEKNPSSSDAKDSLAHALSGKGFRSYQRADYKSALVDITEAIAAKPDYAHAYMQRAWVLEKLGRQVEASQDRLRS